MINKLSHAEYRAVYEKAGYIIRDIQPANIVQVLPKQNEAEWKSALESRLDRFLNDYKAVTTEKSDIVRLLSQDITSGRGFKGNFIPLAKIPETEKFVLLDPMMEHWILAYNLAGNLAPSVIIEPGQLIQAYDEDLGWINRNSMREKIADSTALINEFIGQYRKGKIACHFETLFKALK